MSSRRRGCALIILVLGLLLRAGFTQCKPSIALVNVSNQVGDTVGSLRSEDFVVVVDGVPVKSTLTSVHPNRVVILLDRSGSMRNSLPVENYAALDLLAQLPSNIEVAFATFGRNFTVISGFTSDHDTEGKKLRDVFMHEDPPKGMTPQSDAIAKALTLFTNVHLGDAIVVIGDAVDTQSKESNPRLEKLLQQSAVRLYVHALELYNDFKTPEETGGFDSTKKLASSSGGVLLTNVLERDENKNKQRLDQISRQITQRIVEPYALQFEAQVSPDDLKKLKVQLDKKTNKALKPYEVEGPSKIACTTN